MLSGRFRERVYKGAAGQAPLWLAALLGGNDSNAALLTALQAGPFPPQLIVTLAAAPEDGPDSVLLPRVRNPRTDPTVGLDWALGEVGVWLSGLLPQVSKPTLRASMALRPGQAWLGFLESLPSCGPGQPAGPGGLGADRQQRPDPWTPAQARPSQAWECFSPSSQKLFSDTGCRKKK